MRIFNFSLLKNLYIIFSKKKLAEETNDIQRKSPGSD